MIRSVVEHRNYKVAAVAIVLLLAMISILWGARANAISSFAPDIKVISGSSTSTVQTAFDVEDTDTTQNAKKTTISLFSKTKPVGNTAFNVGVTNHGPYPGDRFWGLNIKGVAGAANNYTQYGGNYVVPSGNFNYDPTYQAYKANVSVEFAVYYAGTWQSSTLTAGNRYVHFVVSTDGDKFVSYGSSDVFNVADRAFTNGGGDGWPPKSYYVDMATPCGVNQTVNRTITLGDLDSGHDNNGGQYVSVAVVDVTNGGAASVWMSANGLTRTSWFNEAGMGNNQNFTFSMNFEPYHVYQIRISGIAPRNILKYSIPFDPINTALTCGYSLQPSLNLSATTIDPSQDIKVISQNIQNAGTVTPGPATYKLIRFTVPGGASIPNSTTGTGSASITGRYNSSAREITPSGGVKRVFNAGANAIADVTNNVGNLDPESRICYALAVSPYTQSDSNWRYSDVKCATVNYKYSLTPTINLNPNDVTDTGTQLSVMPDVTNAGPTKSRPTDWKIAYAILNPGVAPANASPGSVSDPCTYYRAAGGVKSCSVDGQYSFVNSAPNSGNKVFDKPGNPSGLSTGTFTIPDVEVGTQICFGLSVRATSSSNGNWAHSALKCVVVAKSPSVQVRGGDLIVGRNTANSEVRTNTKTTEGKVYGSWSEYAIIPSGTVFGMASAAGYAGGVAGLSTGTQQQCQVSQLTFTNSTLSTFTKKPECKGTASGFGNYQLGGTTPSIAARFPLTTATPLAPAAGKVMLNPGSLAAGNYRVTGNFSLETTGVIGVGKWYVINAGSSTVTITKDLLVDSNAVLRKRQDIPQLVIIANNIIIGSGVKQIDAWLIATGTGANGYINTCDTTAKPTAKDCTEKLIVNGPVQANHLYMRRTAGAGAGANSGEPAEVFNLRADAYIWASGAVSGSNRVPTVYSKELPPRF